MCREPRALPLGSVLNQVVLHQSIIGLESYQRPFASWANTPMWSSGAQAAARTGRAHRPVHARQAYGCTAGHALHRGRARELPVAHPWPLCLRLRRHGPDLPALQDVYARQRLHSKPRPRRRPALPWHEPHRLQAQARRLPGCCRRWPKPTSSRRQSASQS